MPLFMNPFKGMVIMNTSHGVVRLMPGMQIECAEAQAAKLQLVPVNVAPTPVAIPVVKRPVPSMPVVEAAVPVAAPLSETKPTIIPAPVEKMVAEVEPEPIGTPIPALELTPEDKGKAIPPAVAPEPVISKEDEKDADELAKGLLQSEDQPKKRGRPAKI